MEKYKYKYEKYLKKYDDLIGGNINIFNAMDLPYWHGLHFLIGRLFDLHNNSNEDVIKNIVNKKVNLWIQKKNNVLPIEMDNMDNLWFPIEHTILNYDILLSVFEKTILYKKIYDVFYRNLHEITNKELINFGNYLLNAHTKQQYGIYFSAVNSKDNTSKILFKISNDVRNIEIDFDLLLDYVSMECEKINVKIENIIYANDGWAYGEIGRDTLRFTNKKNFIENIEQLSKKDSDIELICKMPVDLNELENYFIKGLVFDDYYEIYTFENKTIIKPTTQKQ